jgi:hypothetical protein
MGKDKGQVLKAVGLPVQAIPAQEWWGVQSDKEEWAFGGGFICHYPSQSIAEKHAGTLGPRWKAVRFD